MQDMVKLFLFGGGIGIIVGAFGYIKGIATQIAGVFFVKVLAHGKAHEGIQALVWNEFKPFYSSNYFYSGKNLYSQKEKKTVPIALEYIGFQYRLFFDGWKLIFVKADSDGSSTIIFFRWTYTADELLRRAFKKLIDIKSINDGDRFMIKLCQGANKAIDQGIVQQMLAKKSDKEENHAWQDLSKDLEHYSYRMLDYKIEDIGETREGDKALGRIVLDIQAQSVVEETKNWAKSADWYRERNLPWRRGYLFYGEPGTGKSSLVAAIGKSLGVPIFRFDISTMTNQEFSSFWAASAASTPAIVLIEDIDNVFHGRTILAEDCPDHLNFDHLLNTISGVESSDGILLIITTNTMEHIDPALGVSVSSDSTMSTRPGRIDRVIHLGKPNNEGRTIIAKRILKENSSTDIINSLVDAGINDTGAQFQERCAMVALKLHWKDNV